MDDFILGLTTFSSVAYALALVFISALLTGIAVWAARCFDFLAHPVDRSSHSVPTPQVGGVGICGALLIAFLYLAFFGGHSGVLLPYIALAVAVAWGLALGLFDDLWPLSPIPKLAGQVLLALPLVVWIELQARFALLDGALPFLIWAALVAWIVFFINVYNFMDGVNGQSTVYALFALGAFAAILILDPQTGVSLWIRLTPIAILVAALLGFFPWNFPRPRTFMGDSGSLPVGALLAAQAVVIGISDTISLDPTGQPTPVEPSAPAPFSLVLFIAAIFPFALYIYDVIYTLLRRARRRENILIAHRGHLYQRLLIATGWSHARLLAFHIPFYVVPALLAGDLALWPDSWTMAASLAVVALYLFVYTRAVLRAENHKRHEEMKDKNQ